ncbi:hypothetical protein KDA_09890 [Dictyobacter alpinus]|uniref:Competence protein ComEC n=1 Tax=Dictyobacter alpinus TaxID=2014873 RepID=A0A402B2C8_9CHLR|nr:ComEC/Rec2 family competence protein [Dictyobacter alpinus]GCE25505.1 hypothetical protein KDA_09890 [Dictyobacter alpinus]
MKKVAGFQSDSLLQLQGMSIVVLATAWLMGIVLASWLVLPPFLLLCSSGVVVVAIFLARRLPLSRLTFITLLCLILGAWRYTIIQPANDPQSIVHAIGSQVVKVKGMVSDAPKLAGRARQLKIAVSALNRLDTKDWQVVRGILEVQTPGTTLEDMYGANYGDIVTVQGKLVTPEPHGPADIQAQMTFPRISVNQHGGNPAIVFLYHWRVRFATILSQILPQPYAALLIAIVLGLRTPQLAPLSQAFNVTGTAHLIVPSGFKITVLAGLMLSCTRWLYTGRIADYLPGSPQRSWQRWLSTAIVLLSIAVYTVLSGAGAAAIRSGVMGSLLVLAPRIGRSYNIYTALAVTAIGMSVLDPVVLWDTGFQLSFLGTLGIVLFTPYIQYPLRSLAKFPGGYFLAETCAVTMAAQLATLPIFAITFEQISFIAPIANMLTVPLLGLSITLGLLICLLGLFFLPLGMLGGWLAWPLLWYMGQSILFCAALPGAYITVTAVDNRISWLYYVPLTCTLVYLLYRWPHAKLTGEHTQRKKVITKRVQRWLYVGLALLIITVTGIVSLQQSQAREKFSLTFLRVGPISKPAQGEAILLRTAENKTLLIDGGLDAGTLSQALDSRLPSWQRNLDMVMLTVPRAEHLLGLQDVVTRYRINSIIDAGMLHPSTAYARWRRTIQEQGQPYHTVSQGQNITLDQHTQLQILWPTTQLHISNETRDNTLITRLNMSGLRILFLGAAAQSPYALTQLTTYTAKSALQANIIQIVGDPGKTLSSALITLLQKVQPTLLIITPPASQRQSQTTSTKSQPIHLPPLLSTTHILSIQQQGNIEITGNQAGWHLQPIP